MKKINKEVANRTFFDLKTKQSLLNLYNALNKEHTCGELHKNLILNPNEKSNFLYYELTKNEVILGFRNTSDNIYQSLLKIKDAHIFSENKTNKEKENIGSETNENSINEKTIDNEISSVIKDIKNYSYIQGGAFVSFHKNLLMNYLSRRLNEINKKELTEK